jgi:hypothetical protein
MEARITGSSQNRDAKSNKITVEFTSLSDEQFDVIKRFVHGVNHVRIDVENKELVEIEAYRKLPEPKDDPVCSPYWLPNGLITKTIKFPLDKEYEHHSPSIQISHLCGYNYTKERYESIANQLLSYGFIPMRSQRDNQGMIWEIWNLPGLWSAKGELEEYIKEIHNNHKLKSSISFLCRNVQFGTLDVSVQHAAMCMDD